MLYYEASTNICQNEATSDGCNETTSDGCNETTINDGCNETTSDGYNEMIYSYIDDTSYVSNDYIDNV